MAVVSVSEIWDGRDGSDGEKYERDRSRSFRVRTDSQLDGPVTVLGHASIPALYTLYVGANGELDTGAFVTKRTAGHEGDDPQVWAVKVEYSTISRDPDRQGNASQPENPLLRPPEIEFDFINDRVPALPNIPGPAACTNSAGDVFDPPPEVEKPRLILRVNHNRGQFDPLAAEDFLNSVNSQPVFGFDERKVKLTVYKAKRAYESGVVFWPTQFEFQFNSDTWDLRLLDQGYRKLPAIDGKLQQIRDPATQQPITKPALLDGAGLELAVNGAAVYRTFTVLKERNHNLLNIIL